MTWLLIKKDKFSWFGLCFLLIFSLNYKALSQEKTALNQPEEAESRSFAQNYLVLGLSKNYPVSFSQNRFSPGGIHPLLGYRYNLNNNWMLGVASQFKIFKKNNSDRTLPLWTVVHESLYLIRLYHPNYVMIGPQLIYLLPIKSAKVPFQRDVNYRSEIGIGGSLSFFRIISKKLSLSLGINRWRGTGTTKFQAIEVTAALNFVLTANKK